MGAVCMPARFMNRNISTVRREELMRTQRELEEALRRLGSREKELGNVRCQLEFVKSELERRKEEIADLQEEVEELRGIEDNYSLMYNLMFNAAEATKQISQFAREDMEKKQLEMQQRANAGQEEAAIDDTKQEHGDFLDNLMEKVEVKEEVVQVARQSAKQR